MRPSIHRQGGCKCAAGAKFCGFVAQLAQVIHTYNCSCNLALFQGFTGPLQAWTEGDRELQAGTERGIQSPHEQAATEAVRQHLARTEGVRQLQAAESVGSSPG